MDELSVYIMIYRILSTTNYVYSKVRLITINLVYIAIVVTTSYQVHSYDQCRTAIFLIITHTFTPLGMDTKFTDNRTANTVA